MKKVFFLACIVWSVFVVKAQTESLTFVFPDSSKHTPGFEIGGVGDYIINSNSLTTNFLDKFYSGGYIDADLKDKALAKLQTENRLGADLAIGGYAFFGIGRSKLRFQVGYYDRSHLDARFSTDLFRVMFYGNQPFAGTKADLGNLYLNFLRYQQMQFGASWGSDSTGRIGISASLLNGEQNIFMDVTQADLYTSSDGRSIDLTTSMKFNRSDTSKKGFGSMNGTGFSTAFYFETFFKTKHGKGVIKVQVSDVGSIAWNSGSLTYSKDSSYHFKGYTIANLFDVKDSTFSSTNQDSIINSIVKFKRQSYTSSLPSIVQLNAVIPLSSKIQLAPAVRYMFGANYKPLFTLKVNYFVTKWIMFAPLVNYGGYGNLGYGAEMALRPGFGFLIFGGASNLEGLLNSAQSAGMAGYIRISKSF